MSAAPFRQIGNVASAVVAAASRANLAPELSAFADPAWPEARIAAWLGCAPEAARGLAIARVERRAGGLFDFCDGAVHKALIAATDFEDGESGPRPIDLIAVFSDGAHALRGGLATWAGACEIERRGVAVGPRFLTIGGAPLSFTSAPLPIFRRPLAWLKAGRVGAVPLAETALRDLTGAPFEIVAENVLHGEKIRAAISRPSAAPKIVLRRKPERAA